MGASELLIILVIVLVVFGGKKLPELASGLGQSVRNFRKAMKEPEEVAAKDSPREVGPTRERDRDQLPSREPISVRERDDDRRS